MYSSYLTYGAVGACLSLMFGAVCFSQLFPWGLVQYITVLAGICITVIILLKHIFCSVPFTESDASFFRLTTTDTDDVLFSLLLSLSPVHHVNCLLLESVPSARASQRGRQPLSHTVGENMQTPGRQLNGHGLLWCFHKPNCFN